MAVEVTTNPIPKNSAARAPANLRVRISKSMAADRSAAFELRAAVVVPAGITILFGASGAGKTTLLNCIAGVTRPDSGDIEINGRSVYDSAKGVSIPPQQRGVGYVFQDLALFPHLSVEKNIAYGVGKMSVSERESRVEVILQSFGIGHLRSRKPGEISGGEKQRVAIARALALNPRALLLDEPMAALDRPTKSRIMEDLRAWNDGRQIPVLYVTHNREEVFALGASVLVMENGRIIAQGTPHEVMTAPQQEAVAQLAGFENIFVANVVAVHEERGTMVCRIAGTSLELETPLVRSQTGEELRVGISAGDILLATTFPVGISARNILRGTVVSMLQRDVIVTAKINCGIEFAAHLTLAARDSLHLKPGSEIWLIIKTHSCHLMRV